jgi:DNA-binding NarL/FixJ family response regulator
MALMAILLVTQDRELEARCRQAISAQYSITAIASIADAPAGIATLSPEVVLIDADTLERPYAEKVVGIVTMPGVGRVIVMTAEFIEDEEVALLRCGVQGCCRRGIDADSLRQVLNVTESGVWVTRSLLPRLVSELRRYAQHAATPPPAAVPEKELAEPPRVVPEKLAILTPRERAIVNLLAGGATNKQVAAELDISERTVKGHLSNVFMKLGVTDRLKLVLYVQGDQPPPRMLGK